MHKGQGGAQNENAIENEYAHGSCVSHTRSQFRTRSDTARGFTASLIYAALSGLGVVWVVVIFLTAENAEVLKIACFNVGLCLIQVFNCQLSIVNCQLSIVNS